MDYQNLIDLVLLGEIARVDGEVGALLDGGASPREIIDNGISPAMEIVGQRFSAGEIFIPEMIVAARASQRTLERLKPNLVKDNIQSIGKVVIGTVKGDLHDIGKNIVSMMLKSARFEVMDLGADVTPEKFVEAIREIKPNLVCMSCLLSTTALSMREIIDQVVESGLRGRVKIMIGGPPTSEEFAREIGADFYGENAIAGIHFAKETVNN